MLLPSTFNTLYLFTILSTSTLPTTMAQSPNTTTTTTQTGPFNLSSPPGTDIWRKPPTHNAFNAATFPATPPTIPLPTFHRAKLTFALPPASHLRQYDQAGLLLHLTQPNLPAHKTKWIKTGIEFYHGKPYVATVGCDTWADWSLAPMPEFAAAGSKGNISDDKPGATIEARREQDELGKSIWIYWIVRDGEGREVERRPLREVTWALAGEEDWNVSVAGYVCRPTREGGDGELEAVFGEGLEIEVLQGGGGRVA
ncbi:hypothetical protein J1614_009923 [Plenodomus biglobosus]|nr:hypothetical protein J1614_009923 [Plenodomus biglobosus]